MIASLCQYVALHLNLAQLTAQFNKFLAFSGAEGTGLGGCYTNGFIG